MASIGCEGKSVGRVLGPVLKMGGAGDPPAPVGDPPTGTVAGNVAKGRAHWLERSLPSRPASRRTAQAGRLCYQQTIFQTRSETGKQISQPWRVAPLEWRRTSEYGRVRDANLSPVRETA